MARKVIQPIGNKLIVLPLPKQEEKIDSLILPETANADLSEGRVIEAAKELEHLIKAGDTVIFSSGSGSGTFYQGKPHLFLQVHEIWGIVTKED